METSSVVNRGHLPGLTTSNHISRRDSMSSARTRDSGYNSDLEFSFSPIECLQSSSDLRFLVTPPALSDVEEIPYTLPFRSGLHKTSPEKRYITSNPAFRSESIPECSHILNSPAQDDAIETWAKNNLRSEGHPRQRLSSIASLSSASSCDMYTNTDDSNDEGDGDSKATQANLPASTRRSIAHVMRKLDVDLRQSAYKKCYGGSTSTAQGAVISTSQQGDGKGTQGSAKRKARADDHLSPDDNDDDGTNKRRRSSLANSNGSEPGTMFACPFFKHDPTRYRNRRTCLGPGWPSVHRVKEHLYRAHVQSIYCPRCYAMFDSDSDLNTHLRSQQCQVSAAQPVEGIDRETLKALRKRSPALRLEEDKWRDMYRLLFPQVPVENIPSPFYNEIAPNESSRRFRRELLRRVHQELVNRAGQLPRPVEQRLLRYVAEIVQSVEDDLVNSFHSSDLSVPSPSDRRESVTSTNSTSSSHAASHITTPPTMPMAHPGPSAPFTTPQVDPVVFDLVTWDDASNHTADPVWADWAPGFPPDSDEQLYKDQYDRSYMGPSMELWH